MVVSNIRSPLYTEYRINDHSIHKVSTAKYLGVIIDHNLSWSDHIGAVSRKANGVLAFLYKNLKKYSSSIKSLGYFTYVRPILGMHRLSGPLIPTAKLCLKKRFNAGLPVLCVITILNMIVSLICLPC